MTHDDDDDDGDDDDDDDAEDDGDDDDDDDDDQWLQTETPGVTHFGAYNRPPDGHFFKMIPYLGPGPRICGSMVAALAGSEQVYRLQNLIFGLSQFGCEILNLRLKDLEPKKPIWHMYEQKIDCNQNESPIAAPGFSTAYNI